MENKTTMQFRQVTIADLQTEIQQLFGWTPLQYSNFIYETGIEYLKQYFCNDKLLAAALYEVHEIFNKKLLKIKADYGCTFTTSQAIASRECVTLL